MDLKEALTTAIGYETKVRDHYTKGAEKILDPRGKKMFTVLAREEQGHLAYLETRLAEWHKSGTISSPELATELPSSQWIDEAKAKVAQSPAGTIAVQGEIELLKIALELERQTSGFYRQLVDTLTLAVPRDRAGASLARAGGDRRPRRARYVVRRDGVPPRGRMTASRWPEDR
jgi:rubrerythrin